MTAADVCPKCWHEGCQGDCQTAAERAAELRRQQVAAAAARRATGLPPPGCPVTARPFRPEVLADPVAALLALGAVVSPDLDAYASGALPLSRVRCVLCGVAPCQCRQCEAPYLRWLADAPEPCGMTIGPDGRCPRGHGAPDAPEAAP